MSSRQKAVAAQNEQIADQGEYRSPSGAVVRIAEELAEARAGTVSYPADVEFGPAPGPSAAGAVVEVTDEGSMQAARRLVGDGGRGVAVLNFASARNPGGGYLRGAKAQEEDVCRSSLLYRCLLEAPDYYAAHRASTDLHYSHRVIWSPGVPVIRDDRGELLERTHRVGFLTSPAPNAGQLVLRSPGRRFDLGPVLAERAGRVLAVAARHGARELVLGAWGCGVFRNDPAEVADTFGQALDGWGAAFDRVVFAVWDRDRPSANRTAFERRFGG
ncbi:TIGR02452 family protein [Kitasatospora sp. NA04385]|uniref:TIGR02452 family protein n=1 Tax=Kitasatospora sp. NA04385 TaxID=2742135 RepID=UPI001590D11E|nr:TIGR02452 family protein [Kitasatospora sp. NA04385]QKW20926.1 TIGR02452 family protein [Kitasatospora sp. NA04385]